MIDLSFIGKRGLIIQYEDIVSLIGYNVIMYLKNNNIQNDKINQMSQKDIWLNYVNRTDEDISVWMKKEFNIDFDINKYLDSFEMFRPNLIYSYKIFSSAYKNDIKKLIIHSNQYSEIIKRASETYEIPSVEYTYGDIIPVLNNNPNITYLTSSPKNIERCLHVDVPFALTIVDDYLYTADVVINKIPEKLSSEKNIFIRYTGVLSAGIL